MTCHGAIIVRTSRCYRGGHEVTYRLGQPCPECGDDNHHELRSVWRREPPDHEGWWWFRNPDETRPSLKFLDAVGVELWQEHIATFPGRWEFAPDEGPPPG